MDKTVRTGGLAAAMMLCAAPALAVCTGNQIEVFACSFGAKQVELCMTTDEQKLTYRFGPKDAPELELTRGFDEITMQPWNGIGRSIWDVVTLPSGSFSYQLFSSFDKFEQSHVSGLEVLRGNQTLATLDCLSADADDGFFELQTLALTMQDAGYCRSDTSDALRMGPCE